MDNLNIYRPTANKASLRYRQTVAIAVISLLLVLLFVFLFIIIILSINSNAVDEPQNNDADSILSQFSELEFTSMTIPYSESQKGTLVLVNGTHEYTFPETQKDKLQNIFNYKNENTVGESKYQLPGVDLMLDIEAIGAMHKMLTDFYNETGRSGLHISSAYRDKTEATDYPDSYTGFSFSLSVYENGISSQITDPENKELYYDWLLSHAHEYGFILRYPEDKAQLTGIANYARSFRYVGTAHATYIYDNDLCLEEYIDLLKTTASRDDPLTLRAADGKSYAIYYYVCDGDDITIEVPIPTPNPDGSAGNTYTVSGTNDGGIVVTVCLG